MVVGELPEHSFDPVDIDGEFSTGRDQVGHRMEGANGVRRVMDDLIGDDEVEASRCKRRSLECRP